ncbi:tripartite motif-containing protein 2-like [Dysidea avara]|uniref:tripartite motif-containing protein 2-like n=1 Tax=Dysidea avara TaxID=196820 RepID=UPI003327D810
MAAMELKRVTDHVTCPVCLQLYKNPKVLPCMHSYCQECLNGLEKYKKITCPECRKIADVPFKGVKDFPTNFTLTHLIDDFFLRRQDRSQINCEVCLKKDLVTSFCVSCSLFMCQLCQQQHKCDKDAHQHVIVYLEEPSQLKVAQPQKTLPNCSDHDLELKFYCDTCERLVCVYCTMNEHVNHSHGAIKKMAAKHREQLKNITTPLEDMITNLSQAHDDITETTERVLQQQKTIDQGIDQFFDDVIQKVEQQRQQLKQKLHNEVSEKVKLLKSQLEEVKNAQAYVMSVNELASKVEESCDDEMLSQGEKQLIHRVCEVTDIYYKTCLVPKENDSFYFVPCTLKPFPQFGHIYTKEHSLQCEVDIPLVVQNKIAEFTITTKDVRGTPLPSEESVVTVQLDSERGNIDSVTVKDNNNGRYTGSFNTELVGHHRLSVSIEGENIEGSPFSFIASRDYSKLSRYNKVINNNGKMGRPWGVAFSSTHHWAVADYGYHCVYVFNEQDKLVRKFGGHGNIVAGMFDEPHGLSFDNDNFLYVVDSNNHRVQKCDLDGYSILQFGSKELSKDKKYGPVGITVHHNKVYIADCGNHRISVYQTDGTYCFSFGSRGNGPGQFQFPWDVAVTPDNTLLVADSGGHCVQSFQLDGTFIGKFGTKGSDKGQLDFPSSIAVDPNGFILVTECGNHRVSIFDKHYSHIHSFGSKGTGKNQFYHPYGIAVTSNGSVYISEYYNKRITVY